MTCTCDNPSDGNVCNNGRASDNGIRSNNGSSEVSMDASMRDNNPNTRMISKPCMMDGTRILQQASDGYHNSCYLQQLHFALYIQDLVFLQSKVQQYNLDRRGPHPRSIGSALPRSEAFPQQKRQYPAAHSG